MKELYFPAVQFRIGRPTHQLAEVIRFYQEGLQLPLLGSFKNHHGYDGVMLGLPDRRYHLEFTSHAAGSPCPAPTKDNLLVLYFDQEDKLMEIKNKLESLGCYPVEAENPYWKSSSFTYEDPDGWRVVLFNGTFGQH